MVAGIGLAATFGAGVTAQLGAMRINEEIDALESMGIRPVEYLVSTRIVAGMIAITPLYSIAVILSFVASQFTTVVLFGQSGGLYDHYFNTFLNPIDLLWSFLQAVLMAMAILLVHTYFGFFATGGPSGVGVAVGNAVRTSLIVVVSVTLLVSLADLRLQRQLQPVGLGETQSMKSDNVARRWPGWAPWSSHRWRSSRSSVGTVPRQLHRKPFR